MNRWTRWARRLRDRHGREDARRAAGPMVLARTVRAAWTQVLLATHRTHLHVHARLGVTRVAAARVFLQRTALSPSAPVTVVPRRDERPDTAGALAVAAPRHPAPASPAVYGAPVLAHASAAHVPFVRSARSRTPHSPQPTQRALPPLHQLVRQWERVLRGEVRPLERPGRLRRDLRRHEPAVMETVRVLARTRTDAPAASRQTPVAGLPQTVREERAAVNPPGTPAINVDALTSQVIQQLDRRLIAYRERMGRG